MSPLGVENALEAAPRVSHPLCSDAVCMCGLEQLYECAVAECQTDLDFSEAAPRDTHIFAHAECQADLDSSLVWSIGGRCPESVVSVNALRSLRAFWSAEPSHVSCARH